jgi:hypothetical protein
MPLIIIDTHKQRLKSDSVVKEMGQKKNVLAAVLNPTQGRRRKRKGGGCHISRYHYASAVDTSESHDGSEPVSVKTHLGDGSFSLEPPQVLGYVALKPLLT